MRGFDNQITVVVQPHVHTQVVCVDRITYHSGVTNHLTEVDWTGLDWTHKNVRNKLINHQKQNLSTRKIEHDGT